jgi:hypothetical protein
MMDVFEAALRTDCLDLKRSRPGVWAGKCRCGGKLVVDLARAKFYCATGAVSGDATRLVMHALKVGYAEAEKFVADGEAAQ